MRLWHYELFPFLPDAQFKGQLRELVAIGKDLLQKGKTNHILINRVMEYPKSDLAGYFMLYEEEYKKRYNKTFDKDVYLLFGVLSNNTATYPPFKDWHNKEYLRICMSNLLEKHRGIGKSRITDEEWARLCDGYEQITGEKYQI
jgi:uncharacterized protein (TIGR02328 family)